jgi:uncharacterized protein (DUF1501 family)
MQHVHPALHRCEAGGACGPLLGRRSVLLGLGAALTLGRAPAASAAASAAGAKRLVVINTIGGLDGLSVVTPYGDPNLAKLRGQIMAPAVGQPGGMLDLGGFYGLHPAMPNLHAMFVDGQAAFVQAVGNSEYTRSHFEGQDYLQSGAPELLASGWLNRVMAQIPAAAGGIQSGMTLSANAPLLVHGPTVTAGWAPDPFPRMSAGFTTSLSSLLQNDPLLGPAFQVGVLDRGIFNGLTKAAPPPKGLTSLQSLAWAAGSFLAAPNGPRVATIETESYDTHFDQVARLATGMADLDGALQALKTTLGAAWAETVIMTMTEFGRTAYANGDATCGTDHGTAFAVILAGGAVQGGRVVADWPGLASTQLYEGRDLMPTVDIRAVAGGILQQHMGLSTAQLAAVFPNAPAALLSGLVN